jgi:hypothetical protein
MSLRFTRHAQIRLQQRSIPFVVVDLLQTFGSESRAGKGAVRFIFDRRAKGRLCKHLGGNEFKHFERWLNAYAVVGDAGEIVTVARVTKRFRRS